MYMTCIYIHVYTCMFCIQYTVLCVCLTRMGLIVLGLYSKTPLAVPVLSLLLLLLCSCRKWGLPQADMNTMFRSLSRLCDLLMNFFSEVRV